MAKIAIVLNTCWNVWNFRLPLLHALEQDGHEIVVIAPQDSYTEKIPFPCHHVDILSRSTNPLKDFKTFLGFIQVFRKVNPEIMLLYTAKPNIYGNFAAGLLGIKTVSNIAGLGTVFDKQNYITVLVKLLYKLSLRVPNSILFQNKDDLALFLEEKIAPGDRVDRVPGSGVDLARFRPIKNEANSSFVFLLPSRMLWSKGVREFVDAGNRLLDEGHNVEIRLVGFLDVDNPNAVNKMDMEEMTRKPGVNYLGASDCMEEELAQADCVVLPSYYREGTPKVLLESASMAKPIITTDGIGCRDVVDDGVNGFLCKGADTDDLYEKMKRMLQLSDTKRVEMGQKGREKIEREFDQEIVIRKYQKAINNILISRVSTCTS